MLSFREYLREADGDKVQPIDKNDLIRIIEDAIKKEGNDCDLNFSRSLLKELEEVILPINEQRFRKVIPSFKTRCDFYLAKISAANDWITARDIDPHNTLCGRGLKYWTLRKMVKIGLLKTYSEGGKIFFTLTKKEQNKK